MTPAQTKIRSWREDPCKFVWDIFGADPDAWQREALEACGGSLRPRRRLAMKACTGPGKSAVLAWIGWHRLVCFAERNEHPKGAALSGEGRDNLRDNLWAELAKWQGRSDFLKAAFTHTQSQIYATDHPETWFLSARSYAMNADAAGIGRSLSGLHSRYPFVLLDEIGAAPAALGQKAEQIFTGGTLDGLVAAAGNPTSTSGLLHEIFTRLREMWSLITITADPDDSRRTPRVDVEHAREQIRLYGRDNPWVMATILGLFPPGSINALLGPDDVEAAMARAPREELFSFAQKRIGVDVARFGDDRTIIYPRQGIIAYAPVELRAARTEAIVGRVLAAKAQWNSEMEFVDGTGGYGAGVIDGLLQSGCSPFEVQFSGAPIDARYFNKRSEIHFLLAEWVKKRGALPRRSGLAKELTASRYYFQNGKLRVEEKEQLKKRLGFSPDEADALACTFALPEMPASDRARYGLPAETGQVLVDYDPFAD